MQNWESKKKRRRKKKKPCILGRSEKGKQTSFLGGPNILVYTNEV